MDRRNFIIKGGGALAFAASGQTAAAAAEPETRTVPHTSIHRIQADGVSVFYREAGAPDAPVVLLLHGFPTSSFQYRELIPRLADRFRVIAPDLPGFGFTEVPAARKYRYTFDALAATILAFTEALNLKAYALYVFDYGAPTGFRVAMAHPERITAIVSQNGNAYEQGLGDAWAPIQRYWRDPSSANRETLRQALDPAGLRSQYTDGVPNPERIAPEGYTLDAAMIARPGNMDIQLDLFLDYANNVKLYPAFQEYFRKSKPPLLAIWGKYDPFFIPPGAEAFRKDNPNAVVEFLDTGHFALETHVEEVAAAMRVFSIRTKGRSEVVFSPGTGRKTSAHGASRGSRSSAAASPGRGVDLSPRREPWVSLQRSRQPRQGRKTSAHGASRGSFANTEASPGRGVRTQASGGLAKEGSYAPAGADGELAQYSHGWRRGLSSYAPAGADEERRSIPTAGAVGCRLTPLPGLMKSGAVFPRLAPWAVVLRPCRGWNAVSHGFATWERDAQGTRVSAPHC